MTKPLPVCIECGKEFDPGKSAEPDRCPNCTTPDEVANPTGGPSTYVEDPHDTQPPDPYDPNPDDLEPKDYEEDVE
ncbi:hypothetical protein [Bhargavaea ginsengi]|uniref:hypothetical protein n=1 Tax=Bhargavaea ginsengi TaxID=426757 RepID=UPI003C772A1A